MNWNIDYPNNTEIENQKRITLDKAFLKRMDRPSPKVVFFNCKTSAAVSLTVHSLFNTSSSPSSPNLISLSSQNIFSTSK